MKEVPWYKKSNVIHSVFWFGLALAFVFVVNEPGAAIGCIIMANLHRKEVI